MSRLDDRAGAPGDSCAPTPRDEATRTAATPRSTPAQLVEVLDQEVATYEALVGVTQREHQALLAFEPLRAEAVLAEKTALLERGHALRALRERLAPGGVLETVTRGSPEADALRERRDRLRALLSALSELNQLAMLQATRQLRWVRTRRRALVGDDTPTYGPRGLGAMRAHGLGLNGMA